MNIDIETVRHLTDLYWLLLVLMVFLPALAAAITVLTKPEVWPLWAGFGGLSVVAALIIVPSGLSASSTGLELGIVRYGVSPETTTTAIEDRYDVMMVEMPEDVGTSSPSSIRVMSGDRIIECFLELVGEPTADGQEAALRCDGGALPGPPHLDSTPTEEDR